MLLGLKASRDNDKAEKNGTAILTNEQMARADRLTVESGVDGYDLMTAAGQHVANFMHAHYPDHDILILCGPGNNGGDGFVAARFLKQAGHNILLHSLVPARKFKGDAKKAVKDWDGAIDDFKTLPDINLEKTVVLDAVFGTGLSKPLQEPVTSFFQAVRQSELPVVAVDIPSGVNGNDGSADPHTPGADYTVTFFRKKLGHVLMPGMDYCGAVHVYDIGIEHGTLTETGFACYENDPGLWRGHVPHPDRKNHKYSRGHIVMCGGPRMTGAVRMAAQAAMRAGAGLCTVAADERAADVYRTDAPHVMYEPLASMDDFAAHYKDKRRNALLLGPGAGHDDQKGLQKAVLESLESGKPLVLDADALNVFADTPERLYDALHENVVLTPHEGEFAKVFPSCAEGSKLDRAQQAAALCPSVILVKGPDTVIVRQDKAPVVNTHASPWLATAGAGDVLAGLIGGFMAQGVEAFDAACMASWVHGEAALEFGPGLTAPDIIDGIPQTLKRLV